MGRPTPSYRKTWGRAVAPSPDREFNNKAWQYKLWVERVGSWTEPPLGMNAPQPSLHSLQHGVCDRHQPVDINIRTRGKGGEVRRMYNEEACEGSNQTSSSGLRWSLNRVLFQFHCGGSPYPNTPLESTVILLMPPLAPTRAAQTMANRRGDLARRGLKTTDVKAQANPA